MNITIKGLDEVLARMQQYPEKLRAVMQKTMLAVLLFIQGKVPSYPQQPAESEYIRTGTLGRTLGMGGQADIFEVVDNGGFTEGKFGTRLKYAPHVIGDPFEEQARHMRHWWTLPKTVAAIAESGVKNLYQTAVDEVAAWLDGKG